MFLNSVRPSHVPQNIRLSHGNKAITFRTRVFFTRTIGNVVLYTLDYRILPLIDPVLAARSA